LGFDRNLESLSDLINNFMAIEKFHENEPQFNAEKPLDLIGGIYSKMMKAVDGLQKIEKINSTFNFCAGIVSYFNSNLLPLLPYESIKRLIHMP
jgi:hypothetical protein